MSRTETPALMTSEEVATLARTTHATVMRWAREGNLHAQKVGGQWRFRTREVMRFLGLEDDA